MLSILFRAKSVIQKLGTHQQCSLTVYEMYEMGFKKPDNLGSEIPWCCQTQPHEVNAFINTLFPVLLISKIKSRFRIGCGAFSHFHGKNDFQAWQPHCKKKNKKNNLTKKMPY